METRSTVAGPAVPELGKIVSRKWTGLQIFATNFHQNGQGFPVRLTTTECDKIQILCHLTR